jgi:predicted MFS family arabinose efflux permease
LHETPRQRVRLDLAGSAALAFGVAGLMVALGEMRELGPGSPWVLAALALGAIGLFAFTRIERRVAAPLVPLDLFRRRAFTAPILASACMSASYMGAFVMAPLMLHGVFALSVSVTAAILLLRTASLTLASPLGGALGMRIGERAAAATGATLMTGAMAVLAYGVARSAFWAVAPGLVLQGLGHGLGLPSLTSSSGNAVEEADLGIASAVNRLTGSVGAGLGITLLTLVYGGSNTPGGFARAFAAGGGLAVLALASALAMRRSAAREACSPASAPATDRVG